MNTHFPISGSHAMNETLKLRLEADAFYHLLTAFHFFGSYVAYTNSSLGLKFLKEGFYSVDKSITLLQKLGNSFETDVWEDFSTQDLEHLYFLEVFCHHYIHTPEGEILFGEKLLSAYKNFAPKNSIKSFRSQNKEILEFVQRMLEVNKEGKEVIEKVNNYASMHFSKLKLQAGFNEHF